MFKKTVEVKKIKIDFKTNAFCTKTITELPLVAFFLQTLCKYEKVSIKWQFNFWTKEIKIKLKGLVRIDNTHKSVLGILYYSFWNITKYLKPLKTNYWNCIIDEKWKSYKLNGCSLYWNELSTVRVRLYNYEDLTSDDPFGPVPFGIYRK